MKKYMFLTLGWICVAIGSVGIFVPLLPTTPFLLLASWLFYNSSENIRQWLLNHRFLGRYVRDYTEGRKMPMRSKMFTLGLMWTTMILSALVFVENWHLRALLLVIGVGVSVHVIKK